MATGNRVEADEFAMWRAVFAFALVDHVLSLEEQDLLRDYLRNVPFSRTQRIILHNDFEKPQDVVQLYRKIRDPARKRQFCALARALVWCEGDMDRQEEEILRRVSCFKSGEDAEILAASRAHPQLETYYRQYAKAGIAGLARAPHIVEMRI
jgi:hypothetical protein